jgi:hypothetical protein
VGLGVVGDVEGGGVTGDNEGIIVGNQVFDDFTASRYDSSPAEALGDFSPNTPSLSPREFKTMEKAPEST